MSYLSEAAMTRRLDWERALDGKPTRGIKDEEEHLQQDLAARWLARKERSPRVQREDKRKAEAIEQRQAQEDLDRSRLGRRGRPRWQKRRCALVRS